jgi:hypothetical protein
MSENALQHLIIGYTTNADPSSATPTVLAVSDELTEAMIAAIQEAVQLEPLAVNGQKASEAVALGVLVVGKVVGDSSRVYVLARCHYQTDVQSRPTYEYIEIPHDVLYSLDGEIETILKLWDKPIPLYAETQTPLEVVTIEDSIAPVTQDDIARLTHVRDTLLQGDMRRLLALLGAAIDGGVIVTGFPVDSTERLLLINGLRLLLPKIARPILTFTTHTTHLDGRLPRIVFSDSEGNTNTKRFDWNSEIDDTPPNEPYARHLWTLWQDDIAALVDTIESLSTLAVTIMPEYLLADGLKALVERHQRDLAVIKGETVASEVMIDILDSHTPPQGDLRLQYMEHLLRLALEERDTAAAQRVAHEMDNDADLDARFSDIFVDALTTQPDAVYVFIRARLAEGIEARWLKRLHDAAEASLVVAVESSDEDTLSRWLNLISREPARYELADVLRSGILAARKRAADNPRLTQDLLVMSVKRQPQALPTLLQDTPLMTALPEHIIKALEARDSAAIEHLFSESRELFLLAVKQTLDVVANSITASIVRFVWEIHTQHPTMVLAPDFRPVTLIKRMADNAKVLTNGALETLLTLILGNGDDELFFEIVPPLAQQDKLSGVITNALLQSGRDLPALLTIINQLTIGKHLEAQDSVAAYTALLARYNEPDEVMPLIEQLARVLVQHPETTASISTMWKIAEYSGELKSESMLRVSMRRLLHDIEQMASETQVVDSVQRLRKAINWSPSGRTSLIRWWRQYARTQNLAQLQKLDKGLEGKRPLEDLRSVIQTSVALRRVIGQRSLEEFAENIHTTFTILQALAESFDPDGKISVDIDSATIRNELDEREDELPAELRQVLATNLKELAQLITTLSDNRSKPSIMRSDESVERQLYTASTVHGRSAAAKCA